VGLVPEGVVLLEGSFFGKVFRALVVGGGSQVSDRE
jgi:hypothetical protein